MPVLTGIDILKIQEYVFASNRLQDVLSASWMVEHVIGRSYLARWGVSLEHVLQSAGGNAVLIFNDIEAAKTWTTHYTRWLHDTAPGLDVVVAHHSYEEGRLARALGALQQVVLPRAKMERFPDAAQLGLSVTASCSITGQPAIDIDRIDADRGNLIGPRVRALRKSDVVTQAKERWQRFLPPSLEHAPGTQPEFPSELDRMGRSRNDTSLIGIVHVDGNGVGEKIKRWTQRCIEDKLDDLSVRTQLREWSDAITSLGNNILDAVVKRVCGCIHSESVLRGTPRELEFALHGQVSLPLRPILLGGDDMTFVCDGRIALDLATTALKAFEKNENQIPHLGEGGESIKLTGCAGVAFVKAHAPFHRGYELAEDLCRSAKQRRRDANQEREETGSWLDWHIGATRPGDSVEDIRKRQYRTGETELTMRPYPLTEFNGRKASWAWLDEKVLGQGEPPQGFRGAQHWADSRNRVKRLRSLILDGRDALKSQIRAWEAVDTKTHLPAGIPDDGFIGTSTPLLDAIELMDIHIRLEPDASAPPEETP